MILFSQLKHLYLLFAEQWKTTTIQTMIVLSAPQSEAGYFVGVAFGWQHMSVRETLDKLEK